MTSSTEAGTDPHASTNTFSPELRFFSLVVAPMFSLILKLHVEDCVSTVNQCALSTGDQ